MGVCMFAKSIRFLSHYRMMHTHVHHTDAPLLHTGSSNSTMQQPRCVWIASLGSSQRWTGSDGRFETNLNSAAQHHLSVVAPASAAAVSAAAAAAAAGPDHIVGAILLRPNSIYNALSRLCTHGRSQYLFWQSVFGGDLEGCLYLFDIVGHLVLDQPQPIMQCFRRQLKNIFRQTGGGLACWFDAARGSPTCLAGPRVALMFACASSFLHQHRKWVVANGLSSRSRSA